MRILTAIGVWLLFSMLSARASEAPTSGMVYNTKEAHSIVYHCQQNRDGFLDCEFTQTAVRKKVKPEELDSQLKKAREEFRSGVNISADDCQMYGSLVDILEGRKKAPKEEGLRELTGMQRRDMIDSAKSMSKFCGSKTEENYLNIIRASHAQDARTCKVSSNTFKQSFNFVQDGISGAGSWVAKGGAEGPCGIVQLSRFEPEKPKEFGFVVWKYFARKAVTNPNGFLFPGLSCKGLDESEYVYDWRSKEYSLGCDYIEFSVR